MNTHIPIKAAARFLWQEPDGTRHEGRGTTRDLSRFGVFIHTELLPPPGTLIQVIVNLAASDHAGVEGQLYGKGVAVRVEDGIGGSAGFAAEVLFQPGWASLLPVAEAGHEAEFSHAIVPVYPNSPQWASLVPVDLPLHAAL